MKPELDRSTILDISPGASAIIHHHEQQLFEENRTHYLLAEVNTPTI